MSKQLTLEKFVTDEISKSFKTFKKIDITSSVENADIWALGNKIEDKVLMMKRILKAASMFIEAYEETAQNMKERAKKEAA